MTKLDTAKEIAVKFLYSELEVCSDNDNSFFSIYLYHPYFETVFLLDENGMFDARNEPQRLRELQEKLENNIRSSSSAEELLSHIRKSYKIEYIRHLYISGKFSDKQCGILLRDIWTTIENNETQDYETTEFMENWLLAVPKEKLMNGQDYKTYLSLPDEVVVFRGVQRGEQPIGFSWTTDIEIAKWFAERFGKGEETAVCQLTIPKNDIVFYTNEVEEKEVVLIPSLIDEDMIEFIK